MLATFYGFTKRKNSTKRPSGGSDWAPEILLKEPTNLVTPVLKLGSPKPLETITGYNYVVFGGRYYFIDAWESYRNDLWYAHCSLDILATYKDNILATSAFVEYDTTPNAEIADMRLSTIATEQVGLEITEFSPAPQGGGSYIITATGRGGSCGMFALSGNALASLMDSLADWMAEAIKPSEDTHSAVTKFARQMVSGGSATNNLRGCIWVPWQVEGPSTPIWLGNFETGKSGRLVNDTPVETNTYSLPIPWKAADWRRGPMCSSITLKLPYVGTVGINALDVKSATSLNIYQSLDKRTGDVAYNVVASNGKTIGLFGGCAGVGIPLGAAAPNLLSATGTVAQMAVAMAGGKSGASLVGSAVSGASELANNFLNPPVTMIGSVSGGASASSGFNNMLECMVVYHNTNVEPNSVASAIGTPTFAVKTLGSLSGFVKTRAASVAAPCGQDIIQRINAHLDAGIFIE